ncbi:zf-TFIIB domain-containing protein [Lusitaniella coriacea]|uniref:zf-TFIIB domain-containing protein n=1 Tax=Lusitaniella coriacea TaxID=1983105 RepID=UPI003CFA7A37
MKCPKCSKEELVDSVLADDLAVKTCKACKGSWIASEDYQTWQAKQPQEKVTPEELGEKLNIEFGQSPLDTRAALCPECSRYLSRAKVKLKTPFFVDRCQQCGGIWCDYGEWDILAQLGLHRSIEQLFERKWQAQVEQQQLLNSERQAMVEKMGDKVAEQVFEIAEVLSQHPHGDFALAYLMRKVVSLQETQRR